MTSRASWAHLRDKREWAFAEKSKRLADSLHEHDRGVVYLTVESSKMPSSLGGVIEISGAPFWLTGGSLFDQLYPLRIPIRILHVADPPLPFRPLVPKVSFMKNRINWGALLQGQAARKLDESDYESLVCALCGGKL